MKVYLLTKRDDSGFITPLGVFTKESTAYLAFFSWYGENSSYRPHVVEYDLEDSIK